MRRNYQLIALNIITKKGFYVERWTGNFKRGWSDPIGV